MNCVSELRRQFRNVAVAFCEFDAHHPTESAPESSRGLQRRPSGPRSRTNYKAQQQQISGRRHAAPYSFAACRLETQTPETWVFCPWTLVIATRLDDLEVGGPPGFGVDHHDLHQPLEALWSTEMPR